MSLRPCQPCRRSKIRCNREVPHCQACVKRGRSSLCVYEMRVSDQEPALPEPHSKRQKKEHRRASGEYQFEWRAFEPGYERSFRYETSTNEKIQQIEPEKEANINHLHQSHFDRGDMTPHETSPKSITATTADKDWVSRPEYRVAAVDDILERPQRILTYQPTPRYAEMTPPASLPPRPNFDMTISERHNNDLHTTHQLLLVLSYLFISSMLPTDVGALWKVICRYGHDWEESFVLQRSQLQSWLVSARKILTNSDGLHTISLEDIELQIRYILFILGQEASPHSSFLAECFQSEYPPYRPFGVRASVALICHAFEGIRTDELEGYESKEIWSRDQNFLSVMASRLKESPLFGPEISMPHLKSMIISLQRAFQCEEIRVSSMNCRTLRIQSQFEVLGYYRRAFLAFDPMLLPKIMASLTETNDITNLSGQHQLTNMERSLDRTNLALRLANIIISLTTERLDAAFRDIREIQESKADQVVAMEMMHVKSFEEACNSNRIQPTIEPTIVRVFHV